MYCAVLLLLLTIGNASFPDFCFQPSSVTEGDVSVQDEDNRKGTIKATSALIALNETLCYKVKIRNPEGEIVAERLYAVKYVGTQQSYGFKIGYNFSIPVIETECMCVCPAAKGRDCSAAWGGCKTSTSGGNTNETCFVVQATGQTPEGCVWVGGEATTCCRVRISPDQHQRATVIQLSTMESRLLFNVTVLDLKHRLTIKEEYTLPLMDSQLGVQMELDEFFKITMKLDGSPKRTILPGDYILYNDKIHHFLGNSLNKLHGYDMSKIGWYKENQLGEIVFREADFHAAMKIRTINCGSSSADVEFNGRYYNTKESLGESESESGYKLTDNLVPLEQYYAPEIKEVKVNTGFHSRSVDLTLQSSRRVTVDLSYRQMYEGKYSRRKNSTETAWLHDLSRIGHFEAAIIKDSYGNNILTIKLIDRAVGVIIGKIEGGEVDEDLTITVPSLSSQFVIKQEVITACQAKLWVCLRTPSTESTRRTCRKPSCTTRQGNIFKIPSAHLAHKKIEDLSYLKMGTWANMGNPASWFDKYFEVGEIIMALAYLLAIGIIVGVVFKVYKKVKSAKEDQFTDDERYPVYGKRMKRIKSFFESEGLDEFNDMKDVGFSKSMEDMLNDGSRSEDWNQPRMHRRNSSF